MRFYLLIFVLLTACSGLEHSEQEKLRRQNAKGEYVYRRSNEILFPIETPKHRIRERYPWENSYVGEHRKITKEFFRCKGGSSHPAYVDHKDASRTVHFDCGGASKHSLPLKDGKEFVYPVLIDILNFIQEKTGKKVVVTCGYRCPVHNVYADSSPSNQASKHMIGAEVDFYVEGLENQPEEALKWIFAYYKETPGVKGAKQYEHFDRYEKSDRSVSTPPWYNKEIFVKLVRKGEGRDFDNSHPYPYISIQVRHDRDSNERVTFEWKKAVQCFRRY